MGNLGRLFAGSLVKSPHPPPITLVLHRKTLLEHWASSPGIEITRAGQVEKFLDFDVEWWTEEQPTIGPVVEATAGTSITNLIVATKAADAMPQVDRLRRYLSSSSTVAFAQNGMCKMWPPVGTIYNNHRYPDQKEPNWVACVITHGVVSLAPFKSIHASVAAASVGPVSLNARSSADSSYLIKRLVASPDLFATEVTKSELWILQLEKLVVNSVINPLTAVLRCKNGDLFVRQNDKLPLVIDSLIREASIVLRRLVMHPSIDEILGSPHSNPALTQNKSTAWSTVNVKKELLDRFSLERLHHMVYLVGHKVRENTSSMLQDVRAGKRTEILDFNGWLVEVARSIDDGLELKTHARLITMVENGLTISRDELGDHFSLSA
jgi:2-dehydropantoate 2-reductase